MSAYTRRWPLWPSRHPRAFSSSLLPGVDNLLGVRLPLLRKMAAQLARAEELAGLFSRAGRNL